MKKIRCLAAALAISMLVSGCASTTTQKTQVNDADLESYPLKGEFNFTYWGQLSTNLSSSFSNQAESPFEQELAKRTGVTVEYLHPAAGSVAESFNILISSGDLPDMIYYPWTAGYPGGAAKAISDEQIISLNDKMEKYAPAFTAYLNANPDVKRASSTDGGDHFGFMNIYGDELLCTSAGLMVRKDWLDELGLDVPETMDEIYTVLKAMKEQKQVELPYSGNLYQAAVWGLFVSAYGVMPELYVDGDKVVYGAVKPGYKEYLTTMNKWYNEGLIDNSFATLDSKTINSNMINGFAAMTNGAGGSALGTYLSTAQAKDPTYDLVGLKSPVLNKGDKPMYSHYSQKVPGNCVAITTACEYPEAAMKYLDYKYTDEGHMLSVFGIEGISYNMVDGEPIYTDLIMNNPDGKTPAAMLAQYNANGGHVSDKRYIMQYYKTEQQKKALENWSYSDAAKHAVPQLTIAEDKVSEISGMLADIQTYSQSMTLKFIMGTEDLANFDSFVETLESMGLEKVLEAYTEALSRYNAR